MKRLLRDNLAYFKRTNAIYLWMNQHRAYLWDQETSHLRWMDTPNLYAERDLGYQTVVGQKVRCKHVIDTAGTCFFVVSDQFVLPHV